MKSFPIRLTILVCSIIAGLGFAVAGIYIGETDDAPGAALIGIILMIGIISMGVRTFRSKK